MAIDVNKLLLNMPLSDNDAGAATVKKYLKELLKLVWIEEEGFDGKRPFGNSGWKSEVYRDMIQAGFVDGDLDSHGYIIDVDETTAEQMILEVIESL